MPQMPIITYFAVQNYEMFPGTPPDAGISRAVGSGVTLIAGINGLGKTTLLMVLLRMLTGPNDLTGAGIPNVGSTLPESATRLNSDAIKFFSQRVSDGAAAAEATIHVTFGRHELKLTRRLNNLELTDLGIDGKPTSEPLEQAYQRQIAHFMGLSSFVDVLLVLHHVVFFPEGRHGALWDRNVQRQLVRAILLPPTTAARIADLERQVGSADSAARNVGNVLYQQKVRLEEARALQATAPSVRAEVKSRQTILSAALSQRTALDQRRDELEKTRAEAELDLVRARISRDDAGRAVERLKFDALSRLFPKLRDAALLTVLKLLAEDSCAICGAHAEVARKAIEAELADGVCPICHSPPAQQPDVVAPHEVERARVDRLHARANQASREQEHRETALAAIDSEYATVLEKMKGLSTEISAAETRLRVLDAKLPRPTEEIVSLQSQVDGLEETLKEIRARRAERAQELREAHKEVQKAAVRKTRVLVASFSKWARLMLSEETLLVRATAQAGIAQTSEQFEVPSFYADMTSATRPGVTRRRTVNDVSESQRELIDLAFRFSLIEASGVAGASTLVMETPEASLDEVAMERVGTALQLFASKSDNRLIATSNLTNAGMISWLFGGPTKGTREKRNRAGRTINLLKVGAKNRALVNDTQGRYPALLEKALAGR